MKKLAQKHPEPLIDLLTERLTFERLGVRLYDRILERVRAAGDSEARGMLDTLQQYRDEEKEHEEWLEEQIRALGGDAHAETEMARLVRRESYGIEQVILRDEAEPRHLFHALLAAELVDNAGWELLMDLADDAEDDDARDAFELRFVEEEDHLDFMREVVERYAGSRVLGEQLRLPTEP